MNSSDDASLLDVARIHRWLASSYWSQGVSRERVERQIANSICVGAHDDGVQVGFAQVVSDRASFTWLADVWVVEEARGNGVARRMVERLLRLPDLVGVRRFMLATRDAHGIYAALGFRSLDVPMHYMLRSLADKSLP